MTEARQSDEWDRASIMIAQLHNAFPGPDGKAISPNDVHPFRRPEGSDDEPIEADISVLKDVFIDGNVPTTPRAKEPVTP